MEQEAPEMVGKFPWAATEMTGIASASVATQITSSDLNSAVACSGAVKTLA